MTKLLHVSASPRGFASESRALADAFLEAYRETHPDADIETFDLWDGSLPEFGTAAAAAKMAVFGGATPQGEAAVAWQAVQDTFARFDAADRYLFSVPMWNSGVPYVLKQFIDVVTQPGLVFGFDPVHGYTGLLTGKKAAVVYTAGVYGPGRGPRSAPTTSPRSSGTGCASPGSTTSPKCGSGPSRSPTPTPTASSRHEGAEVGKAVEGSGTRGKALRVRRTCARTRTTSRLAVMPDPADAWANLLKVHAALVPLLDRELQQAHELAADLVRRPAGTQRRAGAPTHDERARRSGRGQPYPGVPGRGRPAAAGLVAPRAAPRPTGGRRTPSLTAAGGARLPRRRRRTYLAGIEAALLPRTCPRPRRPPCRRPWAASSPPPLD